MDCSNVQVKVESVESESIDEPPPAVFMCAPILEDFATSHFPDVPSIKTEPASPVGAIETDIGHGSKIEIVYLPCADVCNYVIEEEGRMNPFVKCEPGLDLCHKSGADKLEGAELTSSSREGDQMTASESGVQCELEVDVESGTICEKTVECQNADTSRIPSLHHDDDDLTNSLRCHVCHKLFQSKRNLVIHERIHTGEKPFLCHICSKSFSQRTHFTQHMRIHTGEKPFSCHTCQKSFCRKSNLTQHMRVHSVDKPFLCHICQKSFSRKSVLSLHMLHHTGKKPFSCHICQKQFCVKSNLSKHLLIHTGEKLFSCQTCQKSFTLKSNLLQHMRIHTDRKLFSCNTCEKSFLFKSTLSKHMLLHTS